MYANLIAGVLMQQAQLLDLYKQSDQDGGIGLFVLSHLMTSLDFFERSKPPDGCAAVHTQCLICQGLCIRIVAIDMDGRPASASLLGDFDESVERLVAALKELSDPVTSMV